MADPAKQGWTFADPPATPEPAPAPSGWSFIEAPAAASDVTPAAATNVGSALAQPFKEWIPNQAKMANDAVALMAQGNKEWGQHTFWAKPLAAFHLIGGGLDWAFSPINSTVKTFLGDPFERATGIHGSGDFVSSGAETYLSFAPYAKIFEALGLFGSVPVAKSALETMSPAAQSTLLAKEAANTGRDLMRPGAKVTEESMRAMTSYIAHDTAMADEELGKFRKMAQSLSPQAKLDFIDAVETGMHQPDPALQPMADFLRQILDDRKAKIQGLGEGYLNNAIENYFPHIWKDPQKAEQALKDMQFLESKRPLKGSASFLKQRTIDTVKAGIDRGLELKVDNPLDLVAIKLREMDRFYYGTQMIREMKANKVLRFVRGSDRVPTGWAKLDDPAFKVFVRNDPEVIADMKAVARAAGVDVSGAPVSGAFAKVGEWYAPEPVAQVLNNYLSKGLDNFLAKNIATKAAVDVAKFVRATGNTLTTAQLSVSGFHGTFTANDAIVSRASLALEQLLRGEPLRAATTAISAPAAPFRNLFFGGKLKAAYLNPQGATPQMQRTVEALVEAGGRVGMDQYWRLVKTQPVITSLRNGTYFKDALQDLKGTGLAAPFKLAGKVLQDLSSPLMEWWVPRQKLGVFYDLAQDYLRRNPNATTLELRAGMRSVWDSVDNRMGQMVYDNLFWNKLGKDLAHLTVRSVGWNLGTFRELGGGLVDATGNLKRLVTGSGEAEITHRTAYTIVLPIVAGLEGATMTYLLTGKGPQEALDYFYPPTGQTLPNGQKQRISIPSYMKDVVAFKTDPVGTVQNKAAPWITSSLEVLQNRDFYGGLITDPDAPLTTQILDYANYARKQFTPFAWQGLDRLRQSGASLGESAIALLGFQPPPGYITDPEGTQARYERGLQQARRKRRREDYAGARGAAASEAATTPTPPSGGEGWKF